jgi:hypothetical protein
MGSYHICPDGLIPYIPWWLPYMPWRHLYKGTRCIRESTNKEMTPLIYLCHVCSCVLFLRMGEGDRIYLQLLCASFLGSGTGKRIYQSVNRPILNTLSATLSTGLIFRHGTASFRFGNTGDLASIHALMVGVGHPVVVRHCESGSHTPCWDKKGCHEHACTWGWSRWGVMLVISFTFLEVSTV